MTQQLPIIDATTLRAAWPGRHVSRRRFVRQAAAFSAVGPMVLGACVPGQQAGGGQPAVYGGPPVEVIFMRPANESLSRAYVAQAEAFNKKHDNIKGRFEPAPGGGSEWLSKITTMLASDSAPDCFLAQQANIAQLASTGSLLVLDPYLARDRREVNLEDFFPSHLEGGKWRGKQIGLTPDGCAVLEYYNINLFQEAGVPTPKPVWTWNDYLEAARRLTKKNGGDIVQAGIGTVPAGNNLLPWLWSNGSDIFSPDFKQVRVTDPAAIEALQFAADLVTKHSVTSGSPGAALGPNPDRNGKVAMWRANRGAFGGLSSVTSFKFSVVPVARAPRTNQSTTFTTPGHIAIGSNNKRPDAAWTWLKFLTSTEAQIIRSEVQQGGCPSRLSATQHPSYKDLAIPALESTAANKIFADVLTDRKMSRFIPTYIAMDDAIKVLDTQFKTALSGQQSVPAAMNAVKQELEELLRQKPQPQT